MERVTDRLRTTFVPGDDPDGSERRVVADQPVVIYRPTNKKRGGPGGKVAGLTFVVTAANMPLSKYNSIVAALNSVDHVVVGFFVNVLSPARNNHRSKAERIRSIFDELKDEFRVKRYDIVGHSVGGKIALLVAALYDDDRCVRNIVALDPVDQSPTEFTNDALSKRGSSTDGASSNGAAPPPQNPFADDASSSSSPSSDQTRGRRANLSLASTKADVTLTCTDACCFRSKAHNARAIQTRNPSVKLVPHRNSCHMVYCDDDGVLSWKALMGRGKSDDRNKLVREEAITLIKERAARSGGVAGRASGKATSAVGKAKEAMAGGMSDLRELKGEAQRKGEAFAGMAAMSKVVG